MFTFPQAEKVEDEKAEVAKGEYLRKLCRFYDLGLLRPGQKVEILHHHLCPSPQGLGDCDCNPKIIADGRLVQELKV